MAAATNKRLKKHPPKTKTIGKKIKKSRKNETQNSVEKKSEDEITVGGRTDGDVVQWPTASQQLSFFINQFQSANSVQLSSLELESLNGTCIVELSQDTSQNISGKLEELVKVSFGSSWKEVLCGKHLQEGKIQPGSPAVLVISSSALRSLELLRELRSLTKECHAAKLFSKHMKIEEQVSVLTNRVNIASGTPSRIKKLINMEALGMSRLALIVLDMYTDVKGYSLFTLPQIRDEFWDLYKSYLHKKLLEGDLRLCLYGPLPTNSKAKKRKPVMT
ncbi:ATP-dependent RNA helicase DDX1 [Striga asiatica]|uniref:ATP-dependent RNA helicase DDX1 n=1 Tax=Striga asiatica TaxID=4170 RepID=A0A5A7QCB7_STRAF|nr:ATP-dependent RNA helicase DDX1 [Striga asiatica]